MNQVVNGINLITVVLADDHELLRDGVKSLLKKSKEINLVGEASNGRQLLALIEQFQPDVVIVDVKMPLIDGLEATAIIKAKFSKTKIIALSNYDEKELISSMIHAGADGYLLKTITKQELEDAIKAVYDGRTFYCNGTSKQLLSHINENRRKLSAREEEIIFTERQLQVLKLVCKGMSNKQIAEELSISMRTVESHRVGLLEKVGVANVVSLAVFATKKRLI